MVGLAFSSGAIAAGGAGGGAELEEVSSTEFTNPNTILTTPWDDTVTVPSGSNRVLLDMLGATNPGTHSCALDPAGANVALTEMTGSPVGETTDENAIGFLLLEANFPSTGSKVLRASWVGVRRGGRRTVFLRNANQTIQHAFNGTTTGTFNTVSRTRSSGTFPIGSRVYAWMYASATGTYTITGDASEVVDIDNSDNDSWVFAAGTLASAKATVTVTFTRDAGLNVRKSAGIAIVEPV